MKKRLFGVLLLAVCGLTGCFNADNGSNIQTSDVMPAVATYNWELGKQTLITTWGEIITLTASPASYLNEGDCVLMQVEVDWDNQPYAEKGYITPTKMVTSEETIGKTYVPIEEGEPDPEDYTFPIVNTVPTNYTLRDVWFVVTTYQTFQNQEVDYRMELVQTGDYTYDAYLMERSSTATGTTSEGSDLHAFELPSGLFPELPASSVERPYITITLKYYVGSETIWKALESSPMKVYQF
ncbi:MAG: hypothetical protein LBN93_03815 [Candidatus Symbiothrix sp.]|jgi:hypothetical protein|nr:hypothetical protein [Candidatus Symbiothrix sp.]